MVFPFSIVSDITQGLRWPIDFSLEQVVILEKTKDSRGRVTNGEFEGSRYPCPKRMGPKETRKTEVVLVGGEKVMTNINYI